MLESIALNDLALVLCTKKILVSFWLLAFGFLLLFYYFLLLFVQLWDWPLPFLFLFFNLAAAERPQHCALVFGILISIPASSLAFSAKWVNRLEEAFTSSFGSAASSAYSMSDRSRVGVSWIPHCRFPWSLRILSKETRKQIPDGISPWITPRLILMGVSMLCFLRFLGAWRAL